MASFEAVWAEGWWHPFGRFGGFSPFALAGIGLATGDTVGAPESHEPPVAVQWSPSGPRMLVMLGLGVSYGLESGLYVAADVRGYNHTHGGGNLSAGYRF